MADNFKKVTKKAIHQQKVESLDTLGQDLDQFLFQESFTVVESVLGDFVLRVQDNINKEEGMVTTGSISDIDIKAENGAVNVYANSWLLFQDRGVNGSVKKLYNTPHSYTDKKPPVQVFKDWIKRKNINLIRNEEFRGEPSPFKELTEEQMINKAAWGMATKVFQEGFKPRNIYSKEIPQLVEELQVEIADFTVQSIMQSINVKPSAKRVITP
jgi:hypothetical protein